MKKVINFWMVATLLAFCGGVFFSCSKDEENDGKGGEEFCEVAINGNTYTYKGGAIEGAGEFKGKQLLYKQTEEFTCQVHLVFNGFNNNFKNSTPGTYKVINDHYSEGKNLDLAVSMYSNDHSTFFKLSSGGVHNVTEVKFVKTNSNDESEYSVSGNFSCEYKHENGKTFTITGKYKTKVRVN